MRLRSNDLEFVPVSFESTGSGEQVANWSYRREEHLGRGRCNACFQVIVMNDYHVQHHPQYWQEQERGQSTYATSGFTPQAETSQRWGASGYHQTSRQYVPTHATSYVPHPRQRERKENESLKRRLISIVGITLFVSTMIGGTVLGAYYVLSFYGL